MNERSSVKAVTLEEISSVWSTVDFNNLTDGDRVVATPLGSPCGNCYSYGFPCANCGHDDLCLGAECSGEDCRVLLDLSYKLVGYREITKHGIGFPDTYEEYMSSTDYELIKMIVDYNIKTNM